MSRRLHLAFGPGDLPKFTKIYQLENQAKLGVVSVIKPFLHRLLRLSRHRDFDFKGDPSFLFARRTMLPIFFPLIASQDYEAFRDILGSDLPGTYDEWLQLHRKDVAEHRRQLIETSEVEVYPDEFAGFLRAYRTGAGLSALKDFAFAKGCARRFI